MKKFLVLLTIASLICIANAGISLSVNGDTSISEVRIGPSDSFTVDIFVDGPVTPTVDPATGIPTNGGTLFAGGDLQVKLSNQMGVLDGSGVVFPSQSATNPDRVRTVRMSTAGVFSTAILAWEAPWQKIASTSDFLLVSGGNLGNNTIGGYKLMDGLVFHCEGLEDTIIELRAWSPIVYYTWTVTYDDELGEYTKEIDQVLNLYSAGDIIDTIRVRQDIPEPITIGLLGLGGLLLRRSKKLESV